MQVKPPYFYQMVWCGSSYLVRKCLKNFYIAVVMYIPYDSSGRVERVTEPCFSGGDRYWNITFYDEIGRPLRQKLTDNSGNLITGSGGIYKQDYTYDSAASFCSTSPGPRSIIVTNYAGQDRLEIKNALGETEFVYDDLCGLVSYTYDAVGNLTSVRRWPVFR